MNLANLPEDYLYQRIPEGDIDLDERRVLRAIIGGYQDRLCDLRTYTGELRDFWSIDEAPPRVGVLLVEGFYYDGATFKVVRTVDQFGNAPTGSQADLTNWLAGVLGLPPASLSGVSATRFTVAEIVYTQDEGIAVQADPPLRCFLTPGGNTVTVPGDQRQKYFDGDRVNFIALSGGTEPQQRRIGGVNYHPDLTTFDVDLPVDDVSTTGSVENLTHMAQIGATVTRAVDLDLSAPVAGTPGDLKVWAAGVLQIPVASIVSVTLGNDALREITSNVLYQIAQSLGAFLYPSPPTATPDEVVAEQRRILHAYFPRLKIKGTAQSWEVLGRLRRVQDVKYTPLWTRLSPRYPLDVGDTVNDPDFAVEPDQYPQQDIGAYDPWKFNDGPFYEWESGELFFDSRSESYLPLGVNDRQPWVELVQIGTNASLPVGDFSVTLAGGDFGKRASAPLSTGSDASGWQFQAIHPGASSTGVDSFNGLEIHVQSTGTSVFLTIADRMSAIKYRSSYFDLIQVVKFEDTTNPACSSVSTNPEVSGHVGQQGVYPLAGGSASPFVPRRPADAVIAESIALYGTVPFQEVDTQKVLGLANNAHLFEEVRAATRFPRRFAPGLLVEDEKIYADTIARQTIVVVEPGTFTYTGRAETWPLPPYRATFSVEVAGSVAQLTGEVEPAPGFLITPGATTIKLPGDRRREYRDGDLLEFFDLLPYGPPQTRVIAGVLYAPAANTTSFQIYDPVSILVTPINQVSSSGRIQHVNRGPVEILSGSLTADVTGFYNYGDANFSFTFGETVAPGAQVVARWIPLITQDGVSLAQSQLLIEGNGTIRPEPPDSYKTEDNVIRQERPEDSISIELFQLHDEYPWRRVQQGAGVSEDLDYYLPISRDRFLTPVSTNPVVYDSFGTPFEVTVLQFSGSVAPARYTPKKTDCSDVDLRGVPIPPVDISVLNQEAIAGVEPEVVYNVESYAIDSTGTNAYPVGLWQGEPMADPRHLHQNAYLDGLVGWFPFDEHPEAPLRPVDRTAFDQADSTYLLRASDRVWTERGYATRFTPGRFLQVQAFRDIEDELTIGAWIRPELSASLPPIGTTQVFASPPEAVIDLAGTVKLLNHFAVSNFGTLTPVHYSWKVGTGQISIDLQPGSWQYVFLTVYPDPLDTEAVNLRATAGVGTLGNQWRSVASTVVAPLGLTPDDKLFKVGGISAAAAAAGVFSLSDLRLYNRYKTGAVSGPRPGDDLVRLCRPNLTAIPFRGSWSEGRFFGQSRAQDFAFSPVEIVEGGTRYLTGHVNLLPPSPARREGSPLFAQRYDEEGRYYGDLRYQQLGVGGGEPLPDILTLGMSGREISAQGQAVVSSNQGQLPGTGGPAWPINSPGTNPIPPTLYAQNPAQFRIYLVGDPTTYQDAILLHADFVDRGTRCYISGYGTTTDACVGEVVRPEITCVPAFGTTHFTELVVLPEGTFAPAVFTSFERAPVFEVTLVGSGASLQMVPKLIERKVAARERDLILAAGWGTNLTVTNQPTDAVTDVRDFTGFLSVRSAGTAYEVYSVASVGTINRPSVYLYSVENTAFEVRTPQDLQGAILCEDQVEDTAFPGFPALADAGDLKFRFDSVSLPAGRYKMTVYSANAGRLDQDFPGFDTEITIGAVTYPALLQQGDEGRLNPEGETDVPIELESELTAPWEISLLWTNPRVVPEKNERRRLVILGFKFTLLKPDLYRVVVPSSGTVPEFEKVDVDSAPGSPLRPGGWIAALNSYGTVARWEHESRIDTDAGPSLAEIWTGTTERRREDLLMPVLQLPDPAVVPPPTGELPCSISVEGECLEDCGGAVFHVTNGATPMPAPQNWAIIRTSGTITVSTSGSIQLLGNQEVDLFGPVGCGLFSFSLPASELAATVDCPNIPVCSPTEHVFDELALTPPAEIPAVTALFETDWSDDLVPHWVMVISADSPVGTATYYGDIVGGVVQAPTNPPVLEGMAAANWFTFASKLFDGWTAGQVVFSTLCEPFVPPGEPCENDLFVELGDSSVNTAPTPPSRTATLTIGEQVVSVPSGIVGDITSGLCVTGPGIPDGTVVVDVSTPFSEVTLSNPVTLSGNSTLTFSRVCLRNTVLADAMFETYPGYQGWQLTVDYPEIGVATLYGPVNVVTGELGPMCRQEYVGALPAPVIVWDHPNRDFYDSLPFPEFHAAANVQLIILCEDEC